MTQAIQDFTEASKIFVESARQTLFLAVTPLAVIAAQIRTLMQMDILCIKILASLAVFSLTVASVIGVVLLYNARTAVATTLLGDVSEGDPGSLLMKFLSQYGIMDEEAYIKSVKRWRFPFFIFLVFGWISAFAILLIAIWS